MYKRAAYHVQHRKCSAVYFQFLCDTPSTRSNDNDDNRAIDQGGGIGDGGGSEGGHAPAIQAVALSLPACVDIPDMAVERTYEAW